MVIRYRLVQSVDGLLVPSELDETNIIPAMSVRGYEFTGFCKRRGLRPELIGQPEFSGVLGPMWDGEREGAVWIRYECPEAYRQLST
jgi:hypothetical protein